MNQTATQGNAVPPPNLTPRAGDAPGKLAEKVLVRDLNFFYGDN
jgi:hypothetical protein